MLIYAGETLHFSGFSFILRFRGYLFTLDGIIGKWLLEFLRISSKMARS